MIHYHGLPMTPISAMLSSMRGKHGIVSYEHPDQIEDAAEVCQSVVLDNGAFSAWKQGKKHDFGGYEEWACKWLKHPAVEWAIIPDVIDGTEAQNEALMWKWGLPTAVSVPVYHMHESMDWLELLVGRFPRVAIGSSGEFPDPGTDRWWGRMAEIMAVACDEDGMPRVKLHGLRMLDPVLFSHIPFASADSCNVARNVGLDVRWNGPYAPKSRLSRALLMMDRIESHASARKWCGESSGTQQNMELIG